MTQHVRVHLELDQRKVVPISTTSTTAHAATAIILDELRVGDRLEQVACRSGRCQHPFRRRLSRPSTVETLGSFFPLIQRGHT
jgi:hypothetical protein